MADEDPGIAAFARTNRRRNAAITLLLGIIVAIGSAIALCVILASGTLDDTTHHNDGYQLVVWCAGGILVGLLFVGRAIQLYRAKPER